MSTKQQTETKKRTRHVMPYYVVVVFASIAVMAMTVFTPVWDQFPVEITEELEILAVTEKGVVFETSTGVTVVTDQYDGEPGDIIEVTYSVPAKYLDDKQRQQASFDAFHPDP